MHAVESRLAATHTGFCYWHVSKNVVVNCKKFFETEVAWERFLKGFRMTSIPGIRTATRGSGDACSFRVPIMGMNYTPTPETEPAYEMALSYGV
jgi:hypothetical protein